MTKLLLIAAAGGLGTLARYGLGGLVHRVLGMTFPWGTMAVNIVGCFTFGLVWYLAESRMLISGQIRIIVLAGFMGAFTTFSTFIFETGMFLRDGQWLTAILNVAAQNIVGLAALLLGFAVARLI
ncbi:MAG: fluoride efflux transporter CrcB [Desulfarculaceae bacterium]